MKNLELYDKLDNLYIELDNLAGLVAKRIDQMQNAVAAAMGELDDGN